MIISARGVGLRPFLPWFSGGPKNPQPYHEEWLADKDWAKLGTAQSDNKDDVLLLYWQTHNYMLTTIIIETTSDLVQE